MRYYIVLLWPSKSDAQAIEQFRQKICDGSGAGVYDWPAHMSLFYGIGLETPQALLAGLQSVAQSTPSFPLYISGIKSFEDRVIYFKIKQCRHIRLLQQKVSSLVRALGAETPGMPRRLCAAPLTEDEKKNINQWGSYYPFVPHITLARGLAPDEAARCISAGQGWRSIVPRRIMADRISCSLFWEGAGFPESLEIFHLAPAAVRGPRHIRN